MNKWIKETFADYKSTLKELEDFSDRIFYRPVSYWIVRLSVILKLTPSMLTTISFALTILSAYFFFVGNYIPAAILIYVKTVFDCADGQLARYTQTFSKAGQLYDELVDMIGEILVFAGIFYSWNKLYSTFTGKTDWEFFGLLLVSLVMMGIHITVFQNFRMLYQQIDKNKPESESVKPSEIENKFKRIILSFSHIFELLKEKTYKLIPLPNINKIEGISEEQKETLRAKFKKHFKNEVYMFSFLAGTTHHFVLMGVMIAKRPDYIFPAFVIYYNILFAVMLGVHFANYFYFKKEMKKVIA